MDSKRKKQIVEALNKHDISTYYCQIAQTIIQDDFAFEDFMYDTMGRVDKPGRELKPRIRHHRELSDDSMMDSRIITEDLFGRLTLAIEREIKEWYEAHTGKKIKLDKNIEV